MITNNDIREFLGLPRLDREFKIKQVDSLGYNENTLMFCNKSSVDSEYMNLAKLSRDCVIIAPKGYEIFSDHIDVIYTNNPKYLFCRIVIDFRLKSRFQRYFYHHRDSRKKLRDYKDVVYCKECYIGDNVQVDPGAIIGGTDFSPVLGTNPDSLIQFPQMGGVSIGDDVVIKYNAMIGKGTFDFTHIGRRTMIDFGCQIGHNCYIGESCIIAAGTIIGGSTHIGSHTVIGIGAKIRNGIKIGENVSIGMGAVVTKDVPDNVVVVGNPARIIEHKPIFDEEGLV